MRRASSEKQGVIRTSAYPPVPQAVSASREGVNVIGQLPAPLCRARSSRDSQISKTPSLKYPKSATVLPLHSHVAL